MLDPVAHPASYSDSLWLLTPPSCYPTVLPSNPMPAAQTEERLFFLELWASLTGAPSVIPPALWQTGVAALDLAGVGAILEQILTALTTKIPFLWWEPLEYADSVEDLRHYLTIPVAPQGIDMCSGDVIYGTPVLMWVAALCGYGVEDEVYPLPEDLPQGLEILELAEMVLQLPSEHPLAGLTAIIHVLLHSTGTFFLDACPSCWQPHGEDFVDWTDENIAWLADQAAQTNLILARIDALEAWVAEDPTRIETVLQTLLGTYTPPQPSPRPQTLAELWGFIPADQTPSEATIL